MPTLLISVQKALRELKSTHWGCPKGTGIVIEGVTFRSGTTVFSEASQKPLDRVVESLKAVPSLKVEVAGYTDSAGNAKYNLYLSKQRSQAVADYFSKNGIAKERMVVTVTDRTTPSLTMGPLTAVGKTAGLNSILWRNKKRLNN